MKGRKRQIAVDSRGSLIRTLVHPANQSDKVAVEWLLYRIPFTPRWARVIVDSGYETPVMTARCTQIFGIDYIVVPHLTGSGFLVQPMRWVVERSFAWFGRFRRLSKDYEASPLISEAFLYLASIYRLAARLA